MCEQAIRERMVSITGKQVEVVTTNMFVWHTAMTDDSGPSYTLCVFTLCTVLLPVSSAGLPSVEQAAASPHCCVRGQRQSRVSSSDLEKSDVLSKL